MTALAWVAVVAMGFVLGAIGGGGGILTVPILVGLFGMKATEATGSSLFVVGATSAVGAVLGLRNKTVHLVPALQLAVPSSFGAFIARKFLVPAIPATVAGIQRDSLLLVGFACLMLVVAARMARPTPEAEPQTRHPSIVILLGLALGVVSGTFGAGGGFLILPALTLFLGIEIKLAVPTSLTVITVQSLIGFCGELSKPIQWNLIVPVAAVAVVGLVIGLQLRNKLPGRTLQIAFSVVVVLVAVGLFIKAFASQ